MIAAHHRGRNISRLAVLALGGLLAVSVVTPAAAAHPGPPPRLGHRPAPHGSAGAPTSVIVRYRAGTSPTEKAATRARAEVARVRADTRQRLEVVAPRDGQSVDEAVAELSRDPDVEYAEPNHRIVLAGSPADDEWFPIQWGLENPGGDCNGLYATSVCVRDVDIDAAAAWRTATGAGVTVAVLDDGLDFAAPELQGQAWVNEDEVANGVDDDGNGFVDDVNGVNLCAPAGPTTDLHDPGIDWHGTAVASVLGAAADGLGMVGVAPDVRIMAVRWLVAGLCDTTDQAAAAIRYAVDNGADVINASWGSYQDSATMRAAISYAGGHGVLLVAAAGNDGVTSRFYPAASTLPNVLSVASIGPRGSLSSFSNRGSTVDVAAPGEGTLAVCVDHDCPSGYAIVQGTSFAAPHAAGVAALVLQVQPALRADAAGLRAKLINSGVRSPRLDEGITASGRRLNAGRAVDILPPTPTRIAIRPRGNATIGASSVPMTVSWTASADASGIDTYRVRYRKAGSSTWSWIASETSALRAAVTLPVGTAYEVAVTARDRGGNSTTTLLGTTAARYAESSPRATWVGSWTLVRSSSYSGGKARTASIAGRKVRFVVDGRGVGWVAATGPTRGSARVYVDGVYATTVSLHATTTSYRRIVWGRTFGTPGRHTITIVVSGTRGHPRVDLDAMVVAR